MKLCILCNKEITTSAPRRKDSYDAIIAKRKLCNECYLDNRRASGRKWYKNNKPNKDTFTIIRNRERQRRKKIRLAVIEKYGNVCKCCGESQIEFLLIDHVNNNGSKDRKIKGGNVGVYLWLYKHQINNNYQVLCCNCNNAIAFYGYCPHGNIPKREVVTKRLFT